MSRSIALRSLKNLCTFIGAIALFSYFYNWTIDLRHWYVTLGSALMCAILWLCFYVIEVLGGVSQVSMKIAVGLSRLRSKSADSAEPTSSRAEPTLPADHPQVDPSTAQDEQATAPNLPWLNPRRIPGG